MMISLFIIGGFGLLGLSVLCPLIALVSHHLKKQSNRRARRRFSTTPLRLDIVIPAHNEASRIGATLESIQKAIQHLQDSSRGHSIPEIGVYVGADACTDDTAKVARSFAKVSVTPFAKKNGKWAVIKKLVTASNSDWAVLVDSGTLWPEDFLTKFLWRVAREENNVLAIAPSYRPQAANWLHETLWRVETSLKHIESYCGGPVSVHGATVGYRTLFLKNALDSLGNTLWLNDDVVIPLTLRTLYPQGKIAYPVGEVSDAGVEQHHLDIGRRRRMMLGNLQWVKTLLPSYVMRNPVAALVAGRRLFRILWAYWIGLIIVGTALAFHSLVLPGIVGLGVLTASSGSFRQISGAALVSLLAPWLMARASRRAGDWA